MTDTPQLPWLIFYQYSAARELAVGLVLSPSTPVAEVRDERNERFVFRSIAIYIPGAKEVS